MLEMIDIQKTFATDEVETSALSEISLNVDEGEFVAVMGPSGCGKSTLLNIMGALDRPTAGSYRVRGEEVFDGGAAKLTDFRRDHVGFVFQSFNLIEEISVERNIELALIYRGVSAAERRMRVEEVLDRIKLSHRARHKPAQLSGGQQQRVAVARAIVTRPDIILADEPTGNLDSVHGDEVMRLLEELNGEGTTIVMVTHSPTEAQHAGRTIRLFDGQIVAETERAPLV